MKKIFKHIGLITRAGKNTVDTLIAVRDFCLENRIPLSIEQETADTMDESTLPTFPADNISSDIDLILVVGGDGSLLHAAHCALDHDLPVLGINRGHLGFLTDIHPHELTKITAVLNGQYTQESRFLLETPFDIALNDVVLQPDDAQLIQFDIVINGKFVCQQRADGLIIATPTGSTAYALSGGGPILHPSLDAIVLVPMFPHTLSTRPIVVDGNANIELHLSTEKDKAANISCDGQPRIKLDPGTRINIKKHAKKLQLIHPTDYDYYKTLREKLGWQRR